MNTDRGRRKEMVGVVVSDKMDKTVLVEVRAHVPHPVYRKVYLRRRKFAAHDEAGTAMTGDQVKLKETNPISKTKRWKVIEILREGKQKLQRRAEASIEKEVSPAVKEAASKKAATSKKKKTKTSKKKAGKSK